tara:strand:+ start:6599 stop:7789 length:1191 start_codon:yes stop_codon:yes gene_type:complete
MEIFGRQFFTKKEVETTTENNMSFNAYDMLNNYLEPDFERYNGNGYIYFGQDNLYPQYLNDLYNKSALHAAVTKFAGGLISGGGYEIDGEESLAPMKKVELKQFLNLIDGQNSLEKTLTEITQDYLVHSTVYFKVFWNSDKSRILKLKRVEPSKIRIGINNNNAEEIETYYYNFDWRNYGRYETIEYKPFNPLEKDNERCEIYRFILPNPAVNWYTLPSYASATEVIELDAETATYHRANIQNSINPSMLIKFYQKPANPEEERAIQNNIRKTFKGAANTGKAMTLFSDGKDLAPDVEPVVTSQIDKQFINLEDMVSRKILYGHRINPLIVGLKTPGSLGNSTELEVAFEIYQKTVIEPAQKDIESIINTFLHINNLTVTFKLNDVELYAPKTEQK